MVQMLRDVVDPGASRGPRSLLRGPRGRIAIARAGWLVALAYGIAASGGEPPAGGGKDVLEAIRREVRSDHYDEPTREDLAVAEELFRSLFAPAPDETRLKPLLASLGMESIVVSYAGDELRIVRESPRRCSGRGLFAFRSGKVEPLVVQAPHADSDLHTGAIAVRLFLEGRAAGAAWSTAPRDAVIRPGEPTADMAHLEQSFFQAFTRAFAGAHPRGKCLQLHGFAAEERKSPAGAAADAILSAGSETPSAWLPEAAERLRGLGTICVYPRDVQELGGTENAQGAVLRGLGHSGFVHLELGLEMRRKLKLEKSARASLWVAFAEGRP